MKWLVTILAGALLAGCVGNLAIVEPVRYDFGGLDGNGSGSPIPIVAVDVQAAPWLAGPGMNFRLAYAEPLRRQTYAQSSWAAPPAELLEAFLKRRVVFAQPDFDGNGCRLQLVLDEFEQRFDDPQKSSAVLEARTALAPLRGGATLAKKTFLIQRLAPSADARGGAMAARDAVQALADGLTGWLDAVAREKPVIIERCRN